MKFLLILILTITITGETVTHVKGHTVKVPTDEVKDTEVKKHTVKVPTYEVKDTEVKKSFWDSFSEKTGLDARKGPTKWQKGWSFKFNKGGKKGN